MILPSINLLDKIYSVMNGGENMKKLKVHIVSEKKLVSSMAGCGRNNMNFCGARLCEGGKRND